MDIRALMDSCCRGPGTDWDELWLLVAHAALHPVEQLLRHRHLDSGLAEDILQAFYVHLRGDDMHELRAFRGCSERQFEAFIRTTVVRFAGRSIRVQLRDSPQRHVATLNALTDKHGPTARQIEGALWDLASAMPAADVVKLQIVARHSVQLAGTDFAKACPAHLYKDRRVRALRAFLRARYGDRLPDLG